MVSMKDQSQTGVTYLEGHDETKESLLDFQIRIRVILIPENVFHGLA